MTEQTVTHTTVANQPDLSLNRPPPTFHGPSPQPAQPPTSPFCDPNQGQGQGQPANLLYSPPNPPNSHPSALIGPHQSGQIPTIHKFVHQDSSIL